MQQSLTFKNGTTIKWNHGEDGGGSTQYKDFLQVVPSDKKYKRCLEWCAGLSAIAFSLLDAKIIDELVLMDKYKPALDQAMLNAKLNNFDKVKSYHCDKISDIPIHEKFDLIVANPPHCMDSSGLKWALENKHMDLEDLPLHERLVIDTNWKIHEEFFSNITRYLNDNAELFISENHQHTTLIKFIEEAGLKILNFYNADELNSSGGGSNSIIMHLKYEKEIH